MDEMQNKTAADAEIDAKINLLMNPETSGESEGKSGGKKKKRGRRRRRIFLVLVVLLLLLFGAFHMFGGRNVLPYVETAALAKGEIRNTISITGPVEGTDSVDVTSNLHAKITELNVKEGDRVEAGVTVLAKIDTADLENQLQLARGNYDLTVAAKEEAEREQQRAYEKAQQDLRAAEEDFTRKSQLALTGDIAQVEVDTAADALSDARRTLSGFRVENGRAAADETLSIQISNAALSLKQAEAQMNDATIYAPISGTVTRVNTKVGQFADDRETNQALITIENLDELQMEIKVSEYSIGSIRVGQPVRISADILGGDSYVSGEVMSISPTGEEKGGGSTERVIPTKIRILDNAGLIAGITAKAEIVLAEKKDTYVVPIAAVGQDEGGAPVMQFVLTEQGKAGEGRICRMQVKTGIESDLYTELVENPLDALDVQYEALYLPTYDPMLPDGTVVQFAAGGDAGSDAQAPAAAGEESSAATIETDAAAETAEEADVAETEGTGQNG